MSRLTAYYVHPDGLVMPNSHIANAWGGAPQVWTDCCARFLNGGSWMLSNDVAEQLWQLPNNLDVPKRYRLVLRSTFDYAIVEPRGYAELAAAYREFRALNCETNSHLLALAKGLDEMPPEMLGVCFQWTSVAQSLWVKDVDTEERPYDINKDKQHWFLFDRMEAEEKKAEAALAHDPH